MIREIIERELVEPHPFSVASNPEFLREGSAIEDFMRPNRVVLGTEDAMAAAILRDLYRPLYLIETPILMTDVVTAELIKYASNAFLATKISFINEIADLCEALGADVHDVAKGMGLDRRIGGKFLHPGPGYGGSCFPKDTRAALELAREQGLDLRIVRAVIDVNDARIPRMIDKIARRGRRGAGRLHDRSARADVQAEHRRPARVAGDGDPERPARRRGAGPRLRPGGAADRRARIARRRVATASDEYDAARGADALVVATEWNQFRGLDLDRLRACMARPTLVDLRNVYEPQVARGKGFHYTGVGR